MYLRGGLRGRPCGEPILADSASLLCTDHHGKCTPGHSVWWKKFLSMFKGQMTMTEIEAYVNSELKNAMSKLVIAPTTVVPAKTKKVTKPRAKKAVVVSDGENSDVEILHPGRDAIVPQSPVSDADDVAVVPTRVFTDEEMVQIHRELTGIDVDRLAATLNIISKPATTSAEVEQLRDETERYRDEISKYYYHYKHNVPLDEFTSEQANAAIPECAKAAQEFKGSYTIAGAELNKAMLEVMEVQRKSWMGRNEGRHAEARQRLGF
jgi:hypothetical protein